MCQNDIIMLSEVCHSQVILALQSSQKHVKCDYNGISALPNRSKKFATTVVEDFLEEPQSKCLEHQILKGGTGWQIFEKICNECLNFYILVKIKEKLCTGGFDFRLRVLCNPTCYCLLTRNFKIFPPFQVLWIWREEAFNLKK